MEKTNMPAGFMSFETSEELQKFIDAENFHLEADFKKHEPLDIKGFLNRPETKEQKAEWQAEKLKNGEFFQWLNDNHHQHDKHEWAPGINEYLDFFLGKVRQLPYDKLTVKGTYGITTPPPSQQLTLPHIQIVKNDIVFDVMYDFGIEPYYLLRIRQTLSSISKLSLFISEYPPHPRKLQLLQPYKGEQSILAINTEMDLYAVLTILLNEPLLNEAEKKQLELKHHDS